MRRNVRRSKRFSVMTSRSLHIGAVMMMFFAMVIMNLLANSSCAQRTKEIGEKRRILAKLEEDRTRESARWDEMMRPENVDRMLLKHGLDMRYPREDQIVRMNASCKPFAGQLSVAMAHRAAQAQAGQIAKVQSPSRRRRR